MKSFYTTNHLNTYKRVGSDVSPTRFHLPKLPYLMFDTLAQDEQYIELPRRLACLSKILPLFLAPLFVYSCLMNIVYCVFTT